MPSFVVVVIYPLPPAIWGGGPIFPILVDRPVSPSIWLAAAQISPQLQGRQCGGHVSAVEEMVCVCYIRGTMVLDVFGVDFV